jgi:hypothetical protein
MSSRRTVTRGTRIPIPSTHWWWAASARAIQARAPKRRGWRDITQALIERGVATNEDAVRRVFEERVLTWELAAPLSDELGIPSPATVFASPDAAKLLGPTGQEQIARALGALRKLGEGVASDDQASDVDSPDEPSDPGPNRRGRKR